MTFFSKTLENTYQEAVVKTKMDITQAKSDFIKEGQIFNSRTWLVIDQVFVTNVVDYSQVLLEQLTQVDAEHSPIKLKDFRSAKISVVDFERECQEIYNRLREQSANFGKLKDREQFSSGNMERALATAEADFERAEFAYKSKKSIWKWMLNNAKKIIFGSIVTALLAFIIGKVNNLF